MIVESGSIGASSSGHAEAKSAVQADASAPGTVGTARREIAHEEGTRASRRWWDASADAYQSEHGAFLRDDGFVWCPEGLDEAEAGLLGPVEGRRVLEVGCGAAQCGRWLARQGAAVTGVDVSRRQLQHSRRLDEATGVRVPVVQGDACHLPFASAAFDLACSAFGAVPFVGDSAGLMREASRVLRPGGRWVFAVTHPVRWCFPDDPGPAGLVARDSYFDRRPYVEVDEDGRPTYVEHHRTVGDRVREIVAAGFRLVDLVEPTWPDDLTREWGAWSPTRGRVIPGTAIFVCEKPG